MFSVAKLIDAAKASANIETDYRLAKVIGITHAAISEWRRGKALPNESTIEKLCALSGDDPDVISAQIQEARAKTDVARAMWNRIAHRLQHGGAHVAVLCLFSLVLIASSVSPARASTVSPASDTVASLYIMLSGLHWLYISFLRNVMKLLSPNASRPHSDPAAVVPAG